MDIIYRHGEIGNCNLLNGIVDSDGIIRIRHNRTISSLSFRFNRVDSRIFLVIFLMTKRVPWHNRGEPIFNRKLCDSIPGISKEFRNSIGKFTQSSRFDRSSSNSCCMWNLISSTSIFFSASGARLLSHL